MTDQAEFFEVQRLQRGSGLWQNLEPDNASTRERADASLAHLRIGMPNEAFRVVPFGHGPQARLGDVNAEGGIKVDFGWCHMDSGELASTAVIVTLEQANNAVQHGWIPVGEPYAGADGLVVRVRR